LRFGLWLCEKSIESTLYGSHVRYESITASVNAQANLLREREDNANMRMERRDISLDQHHKVTPISMAAPARNSCMIHTPKMVSNNDFKIGQLI